MSDGRAHGSTAGGDRFVIVTGADSSHYLSLCQLLESVEVHETDTRVVVYDLGLTGPESRRLALLFHGIELVRFPYERYPAWFDIRVNAGEYAWKPVIVDEVLHRHRCRVCWLDAGCVVTEPLTAIRKVLDEAGVYCPHSSGRIGDWTHRETLRFLGADEAFHSLRNFNAACIAVDYHNEKFRALVRRWRDCALDRNCIAPRGSSRANHRQDQAVLSVLMHQTGVPEKMPVRKIGFDTHRDVRDRRRAAGTSADVSRTLLLQLRGGLSNRLRTYLSALNLAEQCNRSLRVHWPANRSCGARWTDLFTNQIEEIDGLPEEPPPFDGSDLDALHRAARSKVGSVTVNSLSFLYPRKTWWTRVMSRFRELVAVEAVRERVEATHSLFAADTMGIHVRRGDFAAYLVRKGFAIPVLRDYFPYLDRWHGSYFLSTDGGPEVEQVFRRRYGDRLIVYPKRSLDRRQVAAVQDALVDLYLLQRCTSIVGTDHSSYTSMAGVFGIPCRKVWTSMAWTADDGMSISELIRNEYATSLRLLAGQQPQEP